jgi:hypothetical protein
VKYKLIKASSVDDLQEQISLALLSGWRLHGDIVVTNMFDVRYLQSLVRE